VAALSVDVTMAGTLTTLYCRLLLEDRGVYLGHGIEMYEVDNSPAWKLTETICPLSMNMSSFHNDDAWFVDEMHVVMTRFR